jgi:hypothetical protein
MSKASATKKVLFEAIANPVMFRIEAVICKGKLLCLFLSRKPDKWTI